MIYKGRFQMCLAFARNFRLTVALADFTLPMNVKGELHNDPK